MSAELPRSDRLRGRTALVTGAASGIGRAIGRHLVAAGAEVVLLDVSPAVHDAATDVGAVGALTADVTDEAAVARAVAEAEALLGRIDVLVASHGILTESPVAEMDLATWQRTVDVDLTSVFLLTRAVLPGMLARRDGRIIAVASQLGQKGGVGLAHYAAAKAGVIAFVKSLALEVSSSNVLANVIAPGPVETPLVDGISEEWKERKRRELPLGRFGTVDEVAPTAVLLASDPDGNLFVGQTLGPNSGDVMP
ncbi:SDR family NAD(P)-dependent oxidoreductase [Clavibacter capsici]|uniref:SDR family oxidoreductase n=1 Tax=Clavibacter capsici TaxID=1874630 RepID=A0AAE7CBN8_9MICO|nr:SDR family oxidoreductase [Clavibacter capsici]ALD12421.1 3-oxoacyl-ACP reductase [Clavibacter capsici]QIS44549.1 SDR family oxidoreductase [Clavibacter capsici]